MVAEDIDVKYEDAIKRCKGVAMRHIPQKQFKLTL